MQGLSSSVHYSTSVPAHYKSGAEAWHKTFTVFSFLSGSPMGE
jgi:hypothetical protein